MSHSIELKDCNVVIIANDFNITIMNNIWLYKSKIFTESELQNSINTPVRVEVSTDNCLLSVSPKKLQFSIDPKTENSKEIIISKIGTIVNLLPHTPFSAVGLNFTYFVTPDKNDIHGLTKSLFCNQTAPLYEGLDEENIRFGGYFSQDFMGTRFRLDAKPVRFMNGDHTEEKIQFAYNFNINLSPENAEGKISELLNMWDVAKKHTETLTGKINE